MTTDTVAVLANPSAGRGRGSKVINEVVGRFRGRGFAPTVLRPTSATDAAQQCRDAVADGVAAVVAVGGDGTMHLALQAVAGTAVPFGVVPAGTGNDFVTALQLPADPSTAARDLADALQRQQVRTIDLARIDTGAGESRWFATTLAAGSDAAVAERVNRMRWPRGAVRYSIAVFTELVLRRRRAYTVTVDGTAHQFPAILVAVGNVGWYGSGAHICPTADVNDGMVDVTVVDATAGRGDLIRINKLAYTGRVLEHRAVRTYRGREVRVAADGIVGYADGERIGPLPLTVTCVPDALTLLG